MSAWEEKAPGEFEMIMTLLETGCDADSLIVESSFHGFKSNGESVVHKHQISIWLLITAVGCLNDRCLICYSLIADTSEHLSQWHSFKRILNLHCVKAGEVLETVTLKGTKIKVAEIVLTQIDFYFPCHQFSSGVPSDCLSDFMSRVYQLLPNHPSKHRQIDLNEDVSAV